MCEAIPFDQIGHQIEYEKFKMIHEVIEEADLEIITNIIIVAMSPRITNTNNASTILFIVHFPFMLNTL